MVLTLSLLLMGLNAAANQSSIESKTGYNSSRQFSASLSGTWELGDKAFTDLSLTHTRSPADTIARTDSFTQLSLGAGYSVDYLGFDAGFNLARQPLEQIHSIGGYFGITYFYSASDQPPNDEASENTQLLHTQTYSKPSLLLPVFWIRTGYAINSITSDLLLGPDDGGKDTTLSIDGFYLVNDELVLGSGIGVHFYEQKRNLFKSFIQNSNNVYLNLLTNTVLGYPKTTFNLNANWQLAPRDSLLPRYQATEIETSRDWIHTVDLGWRHQFTKHLYMTPTYEISFQSMMAYTGLLFSLLYVF